MREKLEELLSLLSGGELSGDEQSKARDLVVQMISMLDDLESQSER
jgi:hypothetical protein